MDPKILERLNHVKSSAGQDLKIINDNIHRVEDTLRSINNEHQNLQFKLQMLYCQREIMMMASQFVSNIDILDKK